MKQRLFLPLLLAFAFLTACESNDNSSSDDNTNTPLTEVETGASAVHVAFAGGGWRAHTGHSAWIMGLLEGGEKKLEDIFQHVKTISSNSGGSWFNTMLAFSKAFNEDIQAHNAVDSWNESGWLGQQRALWDKETVCQSKHTSGIDYAICVFGDLLGTDAFRWDKVVEQIVYKGYPIPQSITLDSARQPWAQDKALLLAATLLTDQTVLTRSDLEDIYYQACYNPSVPQLTGDASACSGTSGVQVAPVTFSSMGGSGYTAPPFLSQNSDPKNSWYNVGYKQNTHLPYDYDTTAHIKIQNPLKNDQVPVILAAATSSAAMGFFAMHSFSNDWSTSYTREDFALSFSLDGSVKFVDVNSASLESVKKQSVVRLADGGPVDNSGVAQLVSFLQHNGDAEGFNIVAFDNVTKGFTPANSQGADVGTDIAYLFGKALYQGNKFCAEKGQYCITVPNLQIFDTTALDTTHATWVNYADSGAAEKKLVYTRYAVETVDNPVFGIRGKTRGTLHAFSCIYPGAATVPMDLTRGGSFIAYEDMLSFINIGLLEDGGAGLKHLQAAMGLGK